MPDMMTPEEIVEDAAAVGVVLYLDYDKLRFYGTRPADWKERSAQWLSQRAAVIEYLKNPTTEHRQRIGKAMLTAVKIRQGLPCIYLGNLINPKPNCGCGPLHKCAIYGECVISGQGAGTWRSCMGCQNYTIQ
jgi:hypothetical protein